MGGGALSATRGVLQEVFRCPPPPHILRGQQWRSRLGRVVGDITSGGDGHFWFWLRSQKAYQAQAHTSPECLQEGSMTFLSKQACLNLGKRVSFLFFILFFSLFPPSDILVPFHITHSGLCFDQQGIYLLSRVGR